MIDNIFWYEQSGIKIKTDKYTIYIDPYLLSTTENADYILVTHSHSDHFSPMDIAKVASSETTFIAPVDCVCKQNMKNRISLLPGEEFVIDENHKIEAVPAYNINKDHHPKKNNWVGYIITINDTRIYHTGDTSRIPEMQNIECDIILLPLGQVYTMDSIAEAVECVLDTKAKIAIPIHFGLYEGNAEDPITFEELLNERAQVIVKDKLI